MDTAIAQRVVAKGCNVELPRYSDDGCAYIGILDICGGHSPDYHNHESLICLYDDTASGHSTKVGEALDGQSIYGKYEDTNTLPMLDACSAHFGNTPESSDTQVYHYHVQDAAPFVVGCFGPNDDNSLVTVAQCREFYAGCGDGDAVTFPTYDGDVEYDPWCPCFDADGSNVGTQELPVFCDTSDADGDSAKVGACDFDMSVEIKSNNATVDRSDPNCDDSGIAVRPAGASAVPLLPLLRTATSTFFVVAVASCLLY